MHLNKYKSTNHRCIPTAVCVFLLLATAHATADDEKITYDDHAAPIFRRRCGSCHNPTARKSGLDVTNYLSLMEGGASGAVIEPGDASSSYLFSLVSHESEPFMPPNTDRIPDKELDMLQRWIDGGALENQGSKAVKPKTTMIVAPDSTPGQRPKVIPLPPRMVLEPAFQAAREPLARSLATSPWAPMAAVTGQRQVLLYNTQSLELAGVVPFPEGQPNVVRFSRDGRVLVIGGGRPAASGKVAVWDITTAERIVEVGNELDAVLAADISSDLKRVALGGPQQVVRVYSTETGAMEYEINKHTEWITSVEFSPDGVLLATGDRNGGLIMWEAHTGREYLALDGHGDAVTALSWRGDSNLLASGSEDAKVKLWEPENGKQVKSWNAHNGVLALEFTRDSRIVTTGRDQTVRLWDQNGKQLAATSAMGDIGVSATFCDESRRMIAGNWAGAVRVYNSEDSAELGNLSTGPPLLEQRLAAAQSKLQEQTSAHKTQAEALSKADSELAAAQQTLAAAQQAFAAAESQVDQLDAQANEVQQSRTASEQQRVALSRELAQLQAAHPMASEALRHLTEAIGQAPNATKLAEVHHQLTERLSKMETQTTAIKSKVAELGSTISAADTTLQKTNKKLQSARQALDEATERRTKSQAEVDSLAVAAEAAQQAAATAHSNVTAAQQEVQRWQQEITFRDRMTELRAQVDAARQLIADRQAALHAANEQLAEAQSKVDAAEAQLEKANQDVAHLTDEIRRTRGME